jgi:hypothetical protein
MKAFQTKGINEQRQAIGWTGKLLQVCGRGYAEEFHFHGNKIVKIFKNGAWHISISFLFYTSLIICKRNISNILNL